MNTPKISVIIPTYNRAKMVVDCIRSILQSNYPSFEVIVVDDCSPDETKTEIETAFGDDERVKYLRNKHNSFQAVSRNNGRRLAQGEYLFFLDDDNRVHPNILTELLETFKVHPNAGLVAPMAIHQRTGLENAIWSLGSDFNRWTSQPRDNHPNLPLSKLPAEPSVYPTSYYPNAFMVPTKVFDQVGGFDETYEQIFEESDFGWKIIEAGYKGYVTTTARTNHYGFLEPGCVPALRQLGIEKPRRTYRFARNRLRFAHKHFNWLQMLSVAFIFAPLSALYYCTIALKNRRADIAWAYFKGTITGIFGLVDSWLSKLHTRLGDFWWYSLMFFIACRAADCLNVFVGLWLVPKYVGTTELGAVMPLTNFANFLAIPIAVFASTFRNELTALAVKGKFGQMKTLMRGVFVATAIFLVLAIIVCRLVLPAFLERIRVAEGSLGLVILFTSFVTAIAPIYSNALQTLKKFKASSTIAVIGAPLRLFTMVVMMPFRAITGYFVGQCASPVSQIACSVFCLRKELAIPAEPYWTREIVRRLGRLFIIFGIGAAAGGVAALVETTVLRQRLPELDSASYYMVTRFSDIAVFLASALVFTLFPFTAELAAKGKDTRPLIIKASTAVFVTNASLAAFFCLFGERIISLLPHGNEYATYWWAIPWIIGIVSTNLFSNFYTTVEVSAFRFGYMKWMIPLNLIYSAVLLFVTGYGYFSAYLPASWTNFLATHNITSLSTILWWMTGVAAIKAFGCAIAMLRQKKL